MLKPHSFIHHHDRARRQDFFRQVESFQRSWNQFFWPRLFRDAVFTSADYDRIPRFAYTENPLGHIVSRTMTSIIALALAPIALGWLGLRAYLRYPVVS